MAGHIKTLYVEIPRHVLDELASQSEREDVKLLHLPKGSGARGARASSVSQSRRLLLECAEWLRSAAPGSTMAIRARVEGEE